MELLYILIALVAGALGGVAVGALIQLRTNQESVKAACKLAAKRATTELAKLLAVLNERLTAANDLARDNAEIADTNYREVGRLAEDNERQRYQILRLGHALQTAENEVVFLRTRVEDLLDTPVAVEVAPAPQPKTRRRTQQTHETIEAELIDPHKPIYTQLGAVPELDPGIDPATCGWSTAGMRELAAAAKS